MILKKKRKLAHGLLLLCLIFQGCFIFLNKKPGISAFSPYSWKVFLIGPKKAGIVRGNTFSDGSIYASFDILPNVIKMAIKNTSKIPLALDWKSSNFQIEGKKATGLVHSLMNYDSRFYPPETIINPGATLNLFIAAENRSDWNKASKKWRSFPFFEEEYNAIIDKKFIMLLAFRTSMDDYKYPFEFKVFETNPVTLEQRPTEDYK